MAFTPTSTLPDVEAAAPAERPFDEGKVWEALGTVYDPEIPASIVEQASSTPSRPSPPRAATRCT